MEIVANSWAEVQEALFRDSWDVRLSRHRSPFIYRGLNLSGHGLETSLQRLGGPYDRLERHLLRNFRKYAHSDDNFGGSTWNWLALAQHHGLPTRLLDWTYSPYVALHFATNELDHIGEDARIWCLNYVGLNQYIPEKLRSVIEKESSNVYTPELLDTVIRTLDELSDFEETFLLFLEPPSIDNRIVNQYALFSMLSKSEALLEDWLHDHPGLFYSIRIPAELKWEIRDKLDQANITERVLFPGLGGLSLWLKRHYSSR